MICDLIILENLLISLSINYKIKKFNIQSKK